MTTSIRWSQKALQLIEKRRKDRFSKLLVFFQKTFLFKIPVRPPILRNSTGLLLFSFAKR